MRSVNLPAKVPANRAANDHIGRKVLLAGDSGRADPGSQSVCKNFGERSRVLVRHDAGNRPGDSGVLRRKRSAALEECASSILLIGPIALSNTFYEVRNCGGIDRGLAAQQSGF